MRRTLIPTLVSVALFGLAFPPVSLQPLAWIALVPYLVALRQTSLRGALSLACVCGVLSAYVVGAWFPRLISVYYQQPPLVGAAFFLGTALTMVVPYYVAFAGLYRGLARRFRMALPLLAAAAWVAADLGRGRLFTASPLFIGNPWALLGYSQVGLGPLVQIASVTGVYGITFVLVAVNAGLAELWFFFRDRDRAGREAALGFGLALVPAIAVLGFGYMALRGASDSERLPATTIAIVQGNVDLGTRWRSEFYGRNLDVYLRLTREVLDKAAPEIVFWPEAAMTFFLEEEPLYRAAIASVLREKGAQLVAGGPAHTHAVDTEHFNTIFLLSPKGRILGRYDKEFLVPFAEYFPFAALDFLRRRFERVRVFTPGQPTPPLATVAGAAGVVVCNEAMLPEVVSARVEQGATYLVNPSNDTWTRDPQFIAIQFDIVSLRAVEQRRYLVRSSTSGPSAIIDPWGRVLARTEPGTRDAIVGSIRPRSERSLYARLGDLFALLCVVAVLVALTVRRPSTPHGHTRARGA